MLIGLDNYKEAIECLDLGLKINPNCTNIYE